MTNWQEWLPAAAEGSRWRLIRFKQVDAEGKPVGKPEEALSAGGSPLRFPTERRAALAGRWLNDEAAGRV